jgi:hypothetical protein
VWPSPKREPISKNSGYDNKPADNAIIFSDARSFEQSDNTPLTYTQSMSPFINEDPC